MEIFVNAPRHPRQEKLVSFYNEMLSKKYGNFEFVRKMKVDIQPGDKETRVNLTLMPRKGKELFAQARDMNESRAFAMCLDKMSRQVARMKKKIRS